MAISLHEGVAVPGIEDGTGPGETWTGCGVSPESRVG